METKDKPIPKEERDAIIGQIKTELKEKAIKGVRTMIKVIAAIVIGTILSGTLIVGIKIWHVKRQASEIRARYNDPRQGRTNEEWGRDIKRAGQRARWKKERSKFRYGQ